MSKLIEITTDSGISRFTTAQIDVEYNGNTYVAGQVSDKGLKVEQSSEVKSGRVNLVFSGVDQSIISLFNNENWRDKNCTIYNCDIDQSWQVSNATVINEGVMTGVSYDLGNTKSTVKLTIKSLYGSANRANAPDLGVLFAEWITDDNTIYFGKTGPVSTEKGGKPGQNLKPVINFPESP